MARLVRAATVFLCLTAATATSFSAAADQVLQIERSAKSWSSGGKLIISGSERGTIYLGDRKARYDQGTDVSWILLEEAHKLLLLDHRNAVYQEIPVPVRLEDLVPPDERSKLEEFAVRVTPEVHVEQGDQRLEIDGWAASRVVLRGTTHDGKSRYTYELWMTRDLPIDHHLYADLLESFGALHLGYRTLASAMAGLEGVAVVRSSEVVHPTGSRDVDVRRLVKVSNRDVPASFYEPPPGYRRVPFDPAAWVQFQKGS